MSRLYVGRLSSRTRERDLEDDFSRFGRITRLDMKNGFAFIEYNDPKDADDAVRDMHGRTLDGSNIIVERAKGTEKGPGGRRGEDAPSGTKCFNCGNTGHWARDCPDADGRSVFYSGHEWWFASVCLSFFAVPLSVVSLEGASTVENQDISPVTALEVAEEETAEVEEETAEADTTPTEETAPPEDLDLDPDLPAATDREETVPLPEEVAPPPEEEAPPPEEPVLLPEEASPPAEVKE
ncbi:hypothetical protein PROFUN_04651 [Planoprotostelium fungivorum]|uniref:Uncharacterized protein n=1 Tax=Planoprotostelium fungivorum TaxID=1890364 RepID=A0A2P6NUH8_9EUKA|nr:hypothetical protein PROFUN_04651 [Planoprotostelium fungivorum]